MPGFFSLFLPQCQKCFGNILERNKHCLLMAISLCLMIFLLFHLFLLCNIASFAISDAKNRPIKLTISTKTILCLQVG